MSRLRGSVIGQFLATVVPHGNHRSRFDRDVGETLRPELRLYDAVGRGERRLDVAIAAALVRVHIGRDLVVHQGHPGVGRMIHVEYRRQDLPVHLHQIDAVFRDIAVDRHDTGDRVAGKARLVDGQRVHLHRWSAFLPTDEGGGEFRQFTPSHHRHDARKSQGGRGIDRPDAGMGVGAAHEGGM